MNAKLICDEKKSRVVYIVSILGFFPLYINLR